MAYNKIISKRGKRARERDERGVREGTSEAAVRDAEGFYRLLVPPSEGKEGKKTSRVKQTRQRSREVSVPRSLLREFFFPPFFFLFYLSFPLSIRFVCCEEIGFILSPVQISIGPPSSSV